MKDKFAALALIRANIENHGHHIYIVNSGEQLPRFAYTIGLSERMGHELVFAGGAFYSADQVCEVINSVAKSPIADKEGGGGKVNIGIEGDFFLKEAHSSWIHSLLLGAIDFYPDREIRALQICPDDEHWTLDTPDLSVPWNPTAQPVWQWLHLEWQYHVPRKSTAVTNLEALKGRRITEAARWDEDQWELFAGPGPDVDKEDIRIVPLGTLLAADSSLIAVTSLGVAQALWRDDYNGEWQQWG